jgi:hypothetical protein
VLDLGTTSLEATSAVGNVHRSRQDQDEGEEAEWEEEHRGSGKRSTWISLLGCPILAMGMIQHGL